MSRPQSQAQSQLRTRLLGLAATLGLTAFVLGVPTVLLAIDATPTLGELSWSRLTAPDDGTMALAVIGAVAWIAWLVFTISVLVDIAARVRGLRTPQIPGLAVPQLAAGRLVGVAALLFVSVPTLVAAPLVATAPRAEALSTTPIPPTPTAAPTAASPADADADLQGDVQTGAQSLQPTTTHVAKERAEETYPYTVKRGDSLWKIAKEHLGDSTRYVELVQLNRDVLGDQPDFLTPGTVLRLPVEAQRANESYFVEPGDTLSEIARHQLGDPEDYPEIFDASRSTVQPDGHHLSDPDLIRPGWRLTIPAASPETSTGPKHSHAPPPMTEPVAPPSATPGAPLHASSSHHVGAEPAAPDSNLPGWVLPGLAGGGAVLAGSLLLVLRQHRRTQLRYRTPGHVIAPPPQDVRSAEKSAHASGSITAPRIEDLDRALRHLAGTSAPCPRLRIATLSADAIELALCEPSTLPAPWTGEGTTWRIRLADVPADRPDTVAPYPLLVSVGMDPDGALVLVNLEQMRSVTLTGDHDRATALGRHIAAELALNPWSTLVDIHALGIGDELADTDPLRLHHHAAGDTAFLDRLAGDLEAQDAAVEPDQYRALIATAGASDVQAVQKVAKIITSYPGRAGAAVLAVHAEPRADDTAFHLSSGCQLRVGGLDTELTAAGLSAAEARACATLLDITREATETPVPQPEDPTTPADLAGALTTAYVEPRPVDGPAGEHSLLPDATDAYTSRSATTRDDVETLAPVARAHAAPVVAAQDPTLDEDLARWEAPMLVLPKLTLLGPVAARTAGDAKQVAKRRPFYVELLAYLVLHPHGVTTAEVAAAFGLTRERARSDLSVLRHWLGSDPRTGESHLPDARAQRGHADRGAVYLTRGVLSDIDLFRRLRSRGQAQGESGIDDLVAGLRLVTGEPFAEQRATGWAWLLEGERIDHIITCAIVDVAHIVTTQALATGDLELARFAAETAYRAAPYDETSRLDLIDVAAATGHAGTAQRQLVDDVLNRTDDDLGPIEAPERTTEIIRQRGWSATTGRRENA